MTMHAGIQPFTRHSGRIAPLALANVDTDQIVPARFLHRPRADGFADTLFRDLRRKSGQDDAVLFPLDRPAHAGASILVAGANFGCGSSREHAVWAIADSGFRVVIAPSLGNIFHANALQNGLMALTLHRDHVDRLIAMGQTDPEADVHIDLSAQTVTAGDLAVGFDIDPYRKHALLRGLSETAMTLTRMDAIARFEAGLHARQPWLRSPFAKTDADPARHAALTGPVHDI